MKNKKDYVWNTIGSLLNALTSFVLLIFVTRILDEFQAGLFMLAFSNAQLFLAIGRFGMRAYQATDLTEGITFSSYLTSRILTCIMMLIASLVLVSTKGYSIEKSSIFVFITIIKMADAIEDVFHGYLQQKEHLDLAGKLLTVRNIVTMLSFAVTLLLSKELYITCLVTAIISIGLTIWINISYTSKYVNVKIAFIKKEIVALLRNCMPLSVASFLSIYIYNIPKYAIETYMTDNYQAVFSVLFMPSFAINLFGDFIFRPTLLSFAKDWINHEYKKINNVINKMIVFIGSLTFLFIVGGVTIGINILSLFYNIDLNDFKLDLAILLLAGGFSACNYLLYNVLTAFRKQKIILLGYAITCIFSYFIANVLVNRYNIFGASISYLLSTIVLFTFFITTIKWNLKNNE